MGRILFLGYSNLIKARILPILSRLSIKSYSIAKYEGQDWDDWDGLNTIDKYDTYEEGLNNFKGELVYVSTVNSTHFLYAKLALEHGFHVIVDKPATMEYVQASKLIEVAKQKNLLVCESTVYLYHPQFEIVNDIFKQNRDAPKLLTVHFTMPPFTSNNFRYRKELGGGALMDTLPYAVSTGRYFFKEIPNKVSVQINERNADGLDIEYSLLMAYSNGKSLIGHFGFNTEYINSMLVIGNRTNITFNRVFTIPENVENTLFVDRMNNHDSVITPKGNNFELFLKNVLRALENKEYDAFYNSMLYDAEVKQMIINQSI